MRSGPASIRSRRGWRTDVGDRPAGPGPVRAGIPVADLTAGLYCALGIMVALLEREVTGKGRWVHVSLLEAMVAMMDFQATRWTMKHDVPKQAGNDHPTTIPTGLFKTSDGVINIAGGGQVMWDRIVKVLGIEAEAADPDIATDKLRSQNRAKVNALLERVTLTDTAANWVENSTAKACPAARSTPWTRSSPTSRSSTSAWR